MKDDLISRQAALALAKDICVPIKDGTVYRHRCIDPQQIMDLPSAQRTGRWIDGKVKHIKNGELRNVRECSECGSSYFVYDYYNSVDEIPKFCPNCGADMRGEQNG